ncbi:MAG: peptide/nickel transport system substrate-binding protein [Solirubrobacteraceae bacterium]|nr:peptide/nickel transport system substrate-binding protein [Solirubrobacteraceae bacterium]
MRRMLRGLVCAICACLSMGLVACGGKNENTSGSITAAVTSYPDSLDPALAYSSDAWQSLWLVYMPLLTYVHAQGAAGSVLTPGAAASLPKISSDGRTYRLTLRRGLKYSDGRPVKASDFAHTIKRILNLESVGTSFFEKIEGADAYIKAGKPGGDLPGIATNDRTGAITIRLTEPDGSFANVLAMDYGGLVPSNTPFSNQTKHPPAGIGPFKLARVRVNRGYDLVKVPGFSLPGVPKPKLDRISITVIKNRGRATQDTIRNAVDYMSDPPAPDQIRTVRDRFEGKRYAEFVTNSTYFFFLNHRTPPFDKKAVREAVNYAVDERALVRVYGGLFQPSCNFLPPALQGFRKIAPCPYGDPGQPPNLARARRLIKQAGAQGTTVRVFGTDEPEPKAAAEYLADVLTQIGLKGKPAIISGEAYFGEVSNQKTRAQVGFANYFEDFPRPSNFFALVDGASISETNNLNFGNIDDPKINATLARANRNADVSAVAGDYAAVDRRLIDEAHLVPYGNRKLSVFFSDRINFEDCTVWHPVYNLDYASLCLK